MPEKGPTKRAREDAREGKATSTHAGEFVREEMHHLREGKHGARSTKQAIAIGRSKARQAGVDLRPPAKGTTSARARPTAVSVGRREAGVAATVRGGTHGAAARRPLRGVQARPGAAGAALSPEARAAGAPGVGPESSAHASAAAALTERIGGRRSLRTSLTAA